LTERKCTSRAKKTKGKRKAGDTQFLVKNRPKGGFQLGATKKVNKLGRRRGGSQP